MCSRLNTSTCSQPLSAAIARTVDLLPSQKKKTRTCTCFFVVDSILLSTLLCVCDSYRGETAEARKTLTVAAAAIAKKRAKQTQQQNIRAPLYIHRTCKKTTPTDVLLYHICMRSKHMCRDVRGVSNSIFGMRRKKKYASPVSHIP